MAGLHRFETMRSVGKIETEGRENAGEQRNEGRGPGSQVASVSASLQSRFRGSNATATTTAERRSERAGQGAISFGSDHRQEGVWRKCRRRKKLEKKKQKHRAKRVGASVRVL